MTDIDTSITLEPQSEAEHPLQPIVTQEDATLVEDRSLLNSQNQPNLSRAASDATTSESASASHTKVIYIHILYAKTYLLLLFTYKKRAFKIQLNLNRCKI